MGKGKDVLREREKGTMPVRNLLNPRKMALIIYYCFLQAGHLKCEKAGLGVTKVSVYVWVCSFFYFF